MVNKKPWNPTRNLFGPRADKAQIIYAIDEGERGPVYDIKNYGVDDFGFGNGLLTKGGGGAVTDQGVWQHNIDEGWYFNAVMTASGGPPGVADSNVISIYHNSTGSDIEFPRGTVLLRFNLFYDRITPGVNFYLLGNSVISASVSIKSFAFRWRNSTNTLAFIVNDFNDVIIWDIYELLGSTPQWNIMLTFIGTWGEQGIKGWINGIEGTKEQPTRPTNTGGWTLPTNANDNFNGYIIGGRRRNFNYSFAEMYNFAHWNWQLEYQEAADLLADAYLPTRPRPSAYYATDINPIVGRATHNTVTFNVVSRLDQSSFVGNTFRVVYGNNSIMEEGSYIPSQEIHVDDTTNTEEWVEMEFVLSGLTPGTRYHYIAQYLEDTSDAGWQNFPGGRGSFVTKRDNPNDNFSFIFMGDDHLTNNSDSPGNNGRGPVTLVDKIGFGDDVTEGRLYDTTTTNGYVKKQYFSWIHDREIYTADNDIDFTMSMGDFAMTDGDSNIAMRVVPNLDEARHYRHAIWRNHHNLVIKSGSFFHLLGNHEAELGYLQYENNSSVGWPQRSSTVARKKFIINPIGGGPNQTYPEGGEYECVFNSLGEIPLEGCDWIWPIDRSIPATSGMPWTRYNNDYREFNVYDEDGYNTSPLENYYAFTWGSVLFVCVDVYRYTEVADEAGLHGAHKRNTRSWTYGPAQKTWIEQTLKNSNATWKFVCTHQLPGGGNISLDGSVTNTVYYGRGSGLNLETEEDLWLHSVCKQYSAHVIKGHDHRFAHIVNDGVHYITAPSGNIPTVSGLTSEGWERGGMRNDYGYSEVLGQNKEGVLVNANMMGYVRVDVEGTKKITINFKQTSFVIDYEDSHNREKIYTNLTFNERWISEPYVADSEDGIVVEYTPKDVVVICNDQDGVFDADGNATISDNFSKYNFYSTSSEFTDGEVEEWEEPFGGPEGTDIVRMVPGSDSALFDSSVRVGYTPRWLFANSIYPTEIFEEIWVSNETGIFKTRDGGASWSNTGINAHGLIVFQFMNVPSSDPDNSSEDPYVPEVTYTIYALTKTKLCRVDISNSDLVTIADLREQHGISEMWKMEYFFGKLYISTNKGVYVNDGDNVDFTDFTIDNLEFNRVFDKMNKNGFETVAYSLDALRVDNQSKNLFLGQENKLWVADEYHKISYRWGNINKQIPTFFVNNEEAKAGFTYNSFNNILIFREYLEVTDIASASYLPSRAYEATNEGWAQTNPGAEVFIHLNGEPKWVDFSFDETSIKTELDSVKTNLENVQDSLTTFNSDYPDSLTYLNLTLTDIENINTAVTSDNLISFVEHYSRFISIIKEGFARTNNLSMPQIILKGIPESERVSGSRADTLVKSGRINPDDSTGISIDAVTGTVTFTRPKTVFDLQTRNKFLFNHKYDRLEISVYGANTGDIGEYSHRELEDELEKQNTGLPSGLGRVAHTNFIKTGIFMDQEHNDLFDYYNAQNIQSKFNSALTSDWYDIINSTIHYDLIMQVENNTPGRYINDLYLFSGNRLWAATDKDIFVYIFSSGVLTFDKIISPDDSVLKVYNIFVQNGEIYITGYNESEQKSKIFMSTNEGKSWTEVSTIGLPTNFYVFSIINNTKVVGTENGIYYNDNNFNTWYQTESQSSSDNEELSNIKVLNIENDVNFIIAEGDRYFYTSGNGLTAIGQGRLTQADVTNKVHRFKHITYVGTNEGLYSDSNTILSEYVSFGLIKIVDNGAGLISINDIDSGDDALYCSDSNGIIYRFLNNQWSSYDVPDTETIHKILIYETNSTHYLIVISYEKIKVIDVTPGTGVFG